MSPLPKETRRPTVAFWPTEQEMRVMDALEKSVSPPRPARQASVPARSPLTAVLVASLAALMPAMQGQSF